MTKELMDATTSSIIEVAKNTKIRKPNNDECERLLITGAETTLFGVALTRMCLKGTTPLIPLGIAAGSVITNCALFGEKNNKFEVINIDPINNEF